MSKKKISPAKKAKAKGRGRAVERVAPAVEREAAIDLVASDTKSPYPGLNFYEKEYAPYFAGRDEEIALCARTLLKSNVMLLHGATGCGKSSFLRAGVKPHIARLDHGEGFVGKADALEVIRSTDEPLMAVAKEVRRLVGELGSDAVKPGKSLGDVLALLDNPKEGALIGREAAATLKAVRLLADVMQPAPILVIDQAEEVFTLNTVRRREARLHKTLRNQGKEPRGLTVDEIEAREKEVDHYFRFLWEIAANKDGANNGLKVVVSLRTEYKGQFDDRVARVRSQHPGQGLTGFFLDQLGVEGLIDAIRRPTLTVAEWKELVRDGLAEGAPPARPAGSLVFKFDSKQDKSNPTDVDHYVARRLAKDLLFGDAIPAGGVLPALQVACLRLYKQAAKAMEGASGVFTVRPTHLRRLGSVQNQIHEYLSECIEEECAPYAPQERTSGEEVGKEKVEFSELVDTFHKALAHTLVGSEADGRAVTAQVDDKDFRADLPAWFSGRLEIEQVMSIMENLASKHKLLRKDEQGRWTLGHDSLALALNRWRLSFSREDSGMRMMMMGLSRRPKDWDIDDLYDEDDRPGPLKVQLTRDYFWDRQIPHYALHKGFAKRLNITFDTSNLELSGLVADTRKRAGEKASKQRTWTHVVKAAREREEALDEAAREDGYNGQRVMVAAEWGAFPFIMRNPEKSDNMFEAPLNKAVEKEVMQYAPRWTDVLATNINLGTGLIGSVDDSVPPIKDSDGKADQERLRGYRKTMRASLRKLAENMDTFLPASLGGIRMLQFATDLAFVEVDGDTEQDKEKIRADRRRVQRELKAAEKKDTLADAAYTPQDPIVNHLLSGIDSEDERPHFATGGAFARALASQSGFRVYFGAKHVAALARAAMEARSEGDYSLYAGDTASKRHDLAALTQKCLAHTLWTLGITPAQASFGQERAAVLRLASVGYFTTEYLRTNMDDFVAFIQHFVNRFLADDAPDQKSMRGVRIGRDEVRSAMRDCFTFARFDELGEDVFDLDSVFAYWSDQGRFDAKSMAGAIYQDLISLRERTLEHFQNCAESIAWLRYNGAYEPSSDEAVGAAFAAKERAWRHFKIFNFYDAERYMNKASQKLLARIEIVAKEKSEARAAEDGMLK